MRGNLRPTVASVGVTWNLAFGTAIHKALEEYHGAYGVDPVAEFREVWLDVEAECARENHDFYVENTEEFAQLRNLGEHMILNYMRWSLKQHYETIATEVAFQVPLGLDEVYFCGRIDRIVKDTTTGRYGLVDYKTRANKQDDELYMRKLEMDAQMTGYMWAAQEHAKMHDLPYKKIDFALYVVLYKAYPIPPNLLKSGFLSLDRGQVTTAELFLRAVEEMGLGEWYEDNVKAQQYVEYLRGREMQEFVVAHTVRRNKYELLNQARAIRLEAYDMVNGPSIYPSPTSEWYCLQCPFRAPCLATNDGSDPEQMLKDNYTLNMRNGRYT